MGSTFCSVHVMNSTITLVLNGLGGCQSSNKYRIDVNKKLDEIKNYSNDVGKILKLITSFETKTATFYTVENNGIISTVSEYFDFSTIKEEVQDWFEYRDEYLLVVNCFDGDVLELSLLKEGNCLTSYVTGCADNYGLTTVKFDANIISEVFGVTPYEIEQAYNDDPVEALDNFTSLFKLPLKLAVLDLIDSKEPNVYKTTFIL
ncbi:MAG TPA: hypothetical protein PL044_08245 [Clostridiales bacterium]|nr:hypothetical protein [Clostridiales bacterium]HQK73742.1 hypothetical protein [Clostridiales bacterium]